MKKGKIPPKYNKLPKKIVELLKSGYTEKQIRKIAKQKNIYISDEDFEQARKIILDKDKKIEDDEVLI